MPIICRHRATRDDPEAALTVEDKARPIARKPKFPAFVAVVLLTDDRLEAAACAIDPRRNREIAVGKVDAVAVGDGQVVVRAVEAQGGVVASIGRCHRTGRVVGAVGGAAFARAIVKDSHAAVLVHLQPQNSLLRLIHRHVAKLDQVFDHRGIGGDVWVEAKDVLL